MTASRRTKLAEPPVGSRAQRRAGNAYRIDAQAHKRLRDSILNGILLPGQALDIRGISEGFGVPLQSLQLVIAELEREGLVEFAADGCAQVITLGPEGLLASLHALGVIEAGIVRLAVPALSPSGLEAISAAVLRLGGAVAANDARWIAPLLFKIFDLFAAEVGSASLLNARDRIVYRHYFNIERSALDAARKRVMAEACVELRHSLIILDASAAQRATERLFLLR